MTAAERAKAEAPGNAESASDAAASSPDAPPGNVYTHVVLWLGLAVVVAVVWWIVLVSTAVRTANPVTLNFQQIRQSEDVVTAEVLAVDEGRVRIDRSWFLGEVETAEVTVENLGDTVAVDGGVYLFPLRYAGRRAEVTRALLPGRERREDGSIVPRRGPALIYPDNEESRGQLEAMIRSWKSDD